MEQLESALPQLDLAFMGNPLLRPSGAAIPMTPEQVDEYVKCSEDPIYFIKNYVKIISLDEGVIPFRMWDFQEQFVKMMEENRFVITRMGRQSGKTQTTASYLIWCLLFKENYSIAV